MRICECGGRLKRIHRTFREKFLYMAIFRCTECGAVTNRPRRFMFYFAEWTRCPLCGTTRLNRLAGPDGIDHMCWNLFNLVHKRFGIRLYHCRYCRIQFYDLPRAKKTIEAAN